MKERDVEVKEVDVEVGRGMRRQGREKVEVGRSGSGGRGGGGGCGGGGR